MTVPPAADAAAAPAGAASPGGWPSPHGEAPLSGTFWSAGAEPAAADFDVPEGQRFVEGGLLGRGGMGQVRAVSDRRLQRDVAEKCLLYPNPEGEARLVREARVTARLEHPGVVPVYDAGRDAQGRLCYRMRRVTGRSLHAALRAAADGPARLRLLRPLLDACRAVAYAHARGVIHRDLKPENILLGEFGEALVTDWGLAWDPDERPLSGGLETPRLTQQGAVLGTPGFMGPEQAAGGAPRPEDDVWALGQVLRELLGPDGPAELRAVADQAQAPLAGRYPHAGALADELEAWFEGRRVAAYRYNTAELLGRGLARWRAAALVALIGVFVIVLGSLWSMQRLDAAADRARHAEADTNFARAAADRQLAVALVRQASDAALLGRRPEAEVLAAHALRLGAGPEARGVLAMFRHVPRPERRGAVALPAGCLALALSERGERTLAQCEGDVALFDAGGQERWRRPLRAVAAEFLREDRVAVVDVAGMLLLVADDGGVELRAYIGEDLTELTGDPDGRTLWVHNPTLARWVFVDRLEPLGPPEVLAARLLADRWIAPGENARLRSDGIFEVGAIGGPAHYQRALGAEVGELGGTRLIAADRAGQRFAIGTWDGELIVFSRDPAAPPLRLALGLGPVADLAFSPDGGQVAAVGEQGHARVYAIEAGQLSPAFPAAGHARVAFTDAAELILAGRTIERWALPERSAPNLLAAEGGVSSARFDPAGEALAAVGSYGRVQVWSVADGQRRFRRDLAPQSVIKDVAFTDGGRAVYVPSVVGGQPTLLDARSGEVRPAQPPPADLQRRVAPFGQGLVGYGWGTGPTFFDPIRGLLDDRRRVVQSLPLDLGAAPEGDVAALLLRNGDLMMLSAEPPNASPTLRLNDPSALAVDVGLHGDVLVVGSPSALRIFTPAGERRLALPAGATLVDLALDPAGRRLAVGLRGGDALVYTVEDGALYAILDAHTERVASLDWSPDGRLLATGSWDDDVRLWGMGEVGEAAAVVTEVEAAWGLSLESALSRGR